MDGLCHKIAEQTTSTFFFRHIVLKLNKCSQHSVLVPYLMSTELHMPLNGGGGGGDLITIIDGTSF